MSNRTAAILLFTPTLACLVASAVTLSIRVEPARRPAAHPSPVVGAPILPIPEAPCLEPSPSLEPSPVERSEFRVTLDALRGCVISMEVEDRDLAEVLARVSFESGVEIRQVDPDRRLPRMSLSFCDASLGQVLDVIAGMNLLTCALGRDGVVYVGSAEAMAEQDVVLLSTLGWNRVSMH